MAKTSTKKKTAEKPKKQPAEKPKKQPAEKPKKQPAEKIQTIYDAMLNGHAAHFGHFTNDKNERHFIPATMKELQDIAKDFLKENKTLILADDLEEPANLCHILAMKRKQAR